MSVPAAPRELEHTLAQLPDAPGVYLMLGEHERILYIGKAVSLRSRVRSYFQDSAAHAYRTVKMVERVVDVRWIVVNNEIEALILEANLIKRHQPPFNVRLRDDKRYPYLKVTNEPFPRSISSASSFRYARAANRSMGSGNARAFSTTSSVVSRRASAIRRNPNTTSSSTKSCCSSRASKIG